MSEDISRGERARALMSDPMVQEAFANLKTAVRDLFFELPAEAAEQRERLHMVDRARQHFESIFTIQIFNGQLERDQLLSDIAAEDAAEAARMRALNH